jgi:nicotinate phosphoribosyltransferase
VNPAPTDPGASALMTDFYQLTMLKSYYELGMTEQAVFEFFFRKLAPTRNFMVAAGLDTVLGFLEQLAFSSEDLPWLGSQGGFPASFLERLASLRFTGDVDAMPEGTVFFADEPLLRIVAPLPEAQLVESRLIALLHFSASVASKAVRCVLAAPGRMLLDFGMRRAHGAEAGLLAARCAYIAGFDGTATVLAGRRYGIPLYGTMAHSFVQAHDDEVQAFVDFIHGHPDNATLLIDTYDTEAAARSLVELMPRLRSQGLSVKGVRLDSGDLADHARKVRRILDAGGCRDVRILASGGLDEHAVARLLSAPIDGFGIGSGLTTVADAPVADCVYKLQEYAGRPRRKRSEGKATWPGRKQVFRCYGADGRMQRDIVGLEDEGLPGRPLLVPQMRAGERLQPIDGIDSMRSRVHEQLNSLPERMRGLEPAQAGYSVEISAGVRSLARVVDRFTPRAKRR